MVKIKLNNAGIGNVSIDGVDISHIVTGLSLGAGVGKSRIELQIIDEIEFEGAPEIFIKDRKGQRLPLKDYLNIK